MAFIIQKPQAKSLGELLGTGISSGIQEKIKEASEIKKQAALKLPELERKRERSRSLAPHAGITPEEAEKLDPTDLSQLIRSQAEEKKAIARSTESKEKEKQRFASQRTAKILDRNEEIRETVSSLESSLDQMENAIKEGNLSFFSKDNLANITGIEKFRSPEGAIFLSTGKNFFFSTLKGIQGRPNQLLEQTLLDALPRLGRDDDANLVVTRFMRNEIDLKKEKIRIIDKITDNFIERGQALPANLGSIVSKQMKPIELENQKLLIKDINKIKASFKEGRKTPERKLVKPGTKLTPNTIDRLLKKNQGNIEAAMKEAAELGFDIGE